MKNKSILKRGITFLLSGAMAFSGTPAMVRAEEPAAVEASSDADQAAEEAARKAAEEAARKAAEEAARKEAEEAARKEAEEAARKEAEETARKEAEEAAKKAAEEAARKAEEEAAKKAAEEEQKKAAQETEVKAAGEADSNKENAGQQQAPQAEAPKETEKATETNAQTEPQKQETVTTEAEKETAAQTETTPETQKAETQAQTAPQTENVTEKTDDTQKDNTDQTESETAAVKENEEKDAEKKETEKPVFKGKVRIERKESSDLYENDKTTLVAKVTGANLSYQVRWEVQKVKNDDSSWTKIGEGNETVITVTKENADLYYRAVLTFGKTGAKEVASDKLALPKLKEKENENTGDQKKEDPAVPVQEATEKNTEAAPAADEDLPTLDGNKSSETEPSNDQPETTAAEKTESGNAAQTEPEESETESETAEIEKFDETALVAAQEGIQEVSSNTNKEEDRTEQEPKENPETLPEEDKEEQEGFREEQKTENDGTAAVEETETEADALAGLEVKTVNRSNIRMAADGLSEIYGIAPEGTVFKILGVEGDWVKIEFDGRIGYTHITNVDGLPVEETELDENGEPVETEKKVTIFSSKWSKDYPGETIYLTSMLEGFKDTDDLYFQWMCNKGQGFEEIEGANADSYSFTFTEENKGWGWKLMVYFK